MRYRFSHPCVAALILGLVGLITAYPPAQAAERTTLRLLTVGNSFSANAMEYFEELAAASGKKLVLEQAVIGGSTMSQHLDKARLHEREPKDKAGIYTKGRGLREMLQAEPWDVVTIQQQSLKSSDIATYRPSAVELHDYIKKYSPKSEVVLHETWAYRVDDPLFSAAKPKAGEPISHREMYEKLAAAYRTIAKELNTRFIPVGDAFYLADTDKQWGYRPDVKFDAKQAKPPALPDQTHSLHVGRRWVKVKGMPTLQMDGHHASIAGKYLAGCVFYETLFEADVRENSFVPQGLDPEYAAFLRRTAHVAVEAVVKSPAR